MPVFKSSVYIVTYKGFRFAFHTSMTLHDQCGCNGEWMESYAHGEGYCRGREVAVTQEEAIEMIQQGIKIIDDKNDMWYI